MYVAGSKFHREIKDLENDFDAIVVSMHFPSGAIGTVELMQHSPFGHDQRIEVFGQDGLLVANNHLPLQSQAWNK